jgi:hypothetical protein
MNYLFRILVSGVLFPHAKSSHHGGLDRERDYKKRTAEDITPRTSAQ